MGNLGLINFSLWCFLIGFAFVENAVKSEDPCDIDLADVLTKLLDPENNSLQVQVLRRRLFSLLRDDLNKEELEYKRTSLDNWDYFPDEEKRSLESLARAGIWYKNPPDMDQNDDANYKRSIENLSKNDQLSLMAQSLDPQKRGIGSLVRNGDFRRRQNYQPLIDRLDLKRNVASLARSYNFPIDSSGGIAKKSIATLAKNGELPYPYGKRNIQSLARNGGLGKRSTEYVETPVEKRNIQSIKANKHRNKREASDYFENEMVYQIPLDYEELLQELAASPDYYPVEDKRFLGRLPQMGKPKTTAIPKARRYQ